MLSRVERTMGAVLFVSSVAIVEELKSGIVMQRLK